MKLQGHNETNLDSSKFYNILHSNNTQQIFDPQSQFALFVIWSLNC